MPVADPPAAVRYLLLADISGYTGFMAGVEEAHGVDFSAGIPAGYSVLGALLDGIIEGVQADFTIVKLEGDAVFAAAPAGGLDGRGEPVLSQLQAVYRAFVARRALLTRSANDHVCSGCPAVAHLDLKMVLHRGVAVRQSVGDGTDLLGPAVNVAHRLLKNEIRSRSRPAPLPVPDGHCGGGTRDTPCWPRTSRGVCERGADRGSHCRSRRTAHRGGCNRRRRRVDGCRCWGCGAG